MELHAWRLECLNDFKISFLKGYFVPEVETAVYLGGEVEVGEGGQRLAQERLAEGFQTRPDV